MKSTILSSLTLGASILTTFACANSAPANGSSTPKAKQSPAQEPKSVSAVPDSYKNIKYPPLDEFRATEPVVKELTNGLRVYLMEDHELPLVRMRAMVRAGSAYEPADKVGLASIVGQVMRSGGTEKNPGDKLDDELGALAATIDVSMGALSGGASAGSISEKMPRVLELFADVLRNPVFPEAKIDLAKTALRTAISRRNDQIGGMAGRAFQIAMFGKESPFAREPEYATVAAITREDLLQFHSQYFRADRVTIGLVGSFDSAKVLEMLEKQFGDWKRADAELPKVNVDPLPIDGRSVYFAEKDDVNQTNLFIGGIGVKRDDPDWAALRVGSFVLGAGGFSSRMMKKVRTELGLAYSVGAGIGAEYERVGLFRALCQTKSTTTGQAIDAMLGEIQGMLTTNPPTEEEVQLAKDQILNTEIFEYESKAGILGRRMTLDYYKYPKDFTEQLNRKIRKVTAKEVAAAYQKHLNPKNLKIVAVGNSKEFDKPLSSFGAVTVVDLSIPEPSAPKGGAVTPEALAAGAKAADALLTKMGGKDKWIALKSVKIDMEMSRNQPPIGRMEIKATETAIYPAKSHMSMTIETPMGALDIARGMDGETGWMRQPNPQNPGEFVIAAIPAPQLKQSLQDRRTDLLVMMTRLASGEFTAVKEGEGLKVLAGDSPVATLTLGEDGLVKTVSFRSATGNDSVRTISEYKEKDGMRYAAAWATKDGQADPEVKITGIEWNPKVDEAIFAKPKEDKKED